MRAAAALLAVAAASAACAGGGEGSPSVALRLPDGAPCASPCALELGVVAVGDRRAVALDLQNDGDADAPVSVALEPAAGAFALLQATFDVVAAGSSAPFIVVATPDRAAQATAVLSVRRGEPQVAIEAALSVTGDAPAPRVSPAACEFGVVIVGESRRCTIAVANDGAEPLAIDDVTLEPAGVFTFTGAVALPVFIAAAQEARFEIEARPPAAGRFDGALSLRSGPTTYDAVVVLSVDGG